MIIEDLLVEIPSEYILGDTTDEKFELIKKEDEISSSDPKSLERRDKIVVEAYGSKKDGCYENMKTYRNDHLKIETDQSAMVIDNDDPDHGFLIALYKVDDEDTDSSIYYCIKTGMTPQYSYAARVEIYRQYNPSKGFDSIEVMMWSSILKDNITNDPLYWE